MPFVAVAVLDGVLADEELELELESEEPYCAKTAGMRVARIAEERMVDSVLV